MLGSLWSFLEVAGKVQAMLCALVTWLKIQNCSAMSRQMLSHLSGTCKSQSKGEGRPGSSCHPLL